MRKPWNITAQLNGDASHIETITVTSNMETKAKSLAVELLKKKPGAFAVEVLKCVPV